MKYFISFLEGYTAQEIKAKVHFRRFRSTCFDVSSDIWSFRVTEEQVGL